MRKKLQIFISSTYKDLIEERQSAVEAILNAGHIPAGMELFKAGNEPQLEVIKRWIDESDIYLLILGGRYGSIEVSSGKSYTHLEYEYAIEKGIPLFSVIISQSALDQKIEKIKQDALEMDNNREYKEFKALVTSKICRFFEDKKDIKLAIHETITDFQNRFEFTGWISGKELPNVEALAVENAELKAKMAILLKEQLTPIIDIKLKYYKGLNEDNGHFSLEPLIYNHGNSVAKHLACICTINGNTHEVNQTKWTKNAANNGCQYKAGINEVIYPIIPTSTGYIEFKPLFDNVPLILTFIVMGEDITYKEIIKIITPEELVLIKGLNYLL